MLRNIALRDVCYHSQSFPASVCFQWRAPAHGANKSRLWNLLRAFFFIATTEIFGKHFMDISNFPLCKHFHWTRFIRSKNCHGSTEVNGVNPTNRGETDSYHYRSEVKSKEKKRTGYLWATHAVQVGDIIHIRYSCRVHSTCATLLQPQVLQDFWKPGILSEKTDLSLMPFTLPIVPDPCNDLIASPEIEAEVDSFLSPWIRACLGVCLLSRLISITNKIICRTKVCSISCALSLGPCYTSQ